MKPTVVNLIFSTHSDHAAVNGVHSLISETLKSQNCRIFNLFLLGADEVSSFSGESLKWNLSYKTIRKKGWRYFFRYHAFIKRLEAFLKNNHVDLVVCDGLGCVQLLSHIQRKLTIPSIGILHGKVRLKKKLERQLSLQQKLWKFIAVSEPLKQYLKSTCNLFNDELLHAVSNSISFFSMESNLYSRSKARAALGLPEKAFVFGSVGRLVNVKNHITVISAVSLLKNRQLWPENALLLIIGGGYLQPFLEEKIKQENLEKEVKINGSLNNAAYYMRAFDVFIMPSLDNEGFGMALLEACVARLPVIASDIEVFKVITDKKASYFKPENSEQLALKMEEIIQRPESWRQERGEMNYAYTRKNFDAPVFQKKFWEVARQALNK